MFKKFLLFLLIVNRNHHCRAQSIGIRPLSDSFTFNYNDKEVSDFVKDYNREASEMCNRVANSEWKFATNTSDFNKRRMREQQSVASKFECLSWKKANNFYGSSSASRISSETNLRRQLDKIYQQGKCSLGDDKYVEFIHILSIMKETYNNAKICPYQSASGGDIQLVHPIPFSSETHIDRKSAQYITTSTIYCDLSLDPDLNRIMELSRNELELRYIWMEWHEKIGPPIKNSFMRYVNLANEAANMVGFRDAGEQMRSVYEDSDFYFTVQDLWTKIQPLYKKLFTFVRRGLLQKYGEQIIRSDGPIPAHLFGNMWSQNWRNIIDLVKPTLYSIPDVTGEMIKQGFTAQKIFQMAEEFYTSIGLPPMSPEFWRNSVLEKSNDVPTQCTPSAWDFCNNIDFRIKQCTEVSAEDFINSHHEMAHIQYYMAYSEQSFIYREGPNPAFHEAIAHAIGLNVGGPVHLQKIGLLPSSLIVENGLSIINIEYLLTLALDKLPFIAYSLALEKWRWFVFEKGPIGMNAKWWELKLRYLGIIPPIRRTIEHFDAAEKYHIISDQDYIKYFIATILQFQIYLELCQASNHIGPLHTCDFYRSRDAGRILSEVMKYGSSISSGQLIRILTRGKSGKLSAEPLLEFFRPLELWLDQQNADQPLIGWNSNVDDLALFQNSNRASLNVYLNLKLYVMIFLCYLYVICCKY